MMSPLTQTLQEHPANRAIVLRNATCLYCGCHLTKENSTKEHVIGRRFVPKGKMAAQWNLIAFSCGSCNNLKADLEDDISTITLQPDLLGDAGHNEQAVIQQALERAQKSISRRTKKRVAESREEMKFRLPLAPGVEANFSFTAPAQGDEKRIFELAQYHITGFFYWLTYQEKEKTGRFWPSGFHPLAYANRRDWGNELLTGFARTVVEWEPRLLAITADGFFKCCIRKHPEELCWSWSLEWNNNLRIVGFAGTADIAREIAADLPRLKMGHIPMGGENYIRLRTEKALVQDEEDLLFAYKDSLEEDSKDEISS
jgi:hypothetical protein